MAAHKRPSKSSQMSPNGGRAIYWDFCERAVRNVRQRAELIGVPFDLDAHCLDRLLVDSGWCCAVTGIPFDAPLSGRGKSKRHPFAPSVDRIDCRRGYVTGNVRVVCMIVNYAMNEWGEDALWRLVKYATINKHLMVAA